MLFLNKPHQVIERQLSFGTLTGISVGEQGRNRQEVFLPTPKTVKAGESLKGLRTDLTIGTSRSGRPRINDATNTDAKNLFMVLSSQRRYTRRGSGYVSAPVGQEVTLIACGKGADGDAGRIGHWYAPIVKVHNGDVFRVVWGGAGYGFAPTFYVVHDDEVYSADQPEVEDLYESLGLEAPFTLKYDQYGGGVEIKANEWKLI